MTPAAEAAKHLAALPLGTCRGSAFGRAYTASKTAFNNGRSCKLAAEELGGSDRISLNLYNLSSGPRLYPCEIPVEMVIAFLRDFRPE